METIDKRLDTLTGESGIINKSLVDAIKYKDSFISALILRTGLILDYKIKDESGIITSLRNNPV